MKPIWWLLASSVFFASGEFYSKKYALSPSWKMVLAVLVSYSISVLLWLPAIRQTKELAVTGALWSVLSLMTTVAIGILVFSEKPQAVHWVGLVLAAISVYLLSL